MTTGPFPSPRAGRPSRSLLVAPGSSERFLAKAAASAADGVLLDLEDAVAVADKPAARATVISAVGRLDWGDKTVSVRINALDTPFMYRDLIDLAEQAGPRLDLVMVPKIESAADVHVLDVLLNQIEAATGRAQAIGLALQIETARGLQNVDAIAGASPRVESLHFGPGDYAASISARTTSIGGPVTEYAVLGEAHGGGARVSHPGDPWHYAHARMIVAARAAGVLPVDGPYGDFNDPEGLAAGARRSAAMGFAGKWAIHPSQIDLLNAAFSPTGAEIERARTILAALAEAGGAGRGACVVDGRMVDAASIRQAEGLMGTARRLGLI